MNMESTIQKINVDMIIPNRFQPRLSFDEEALNELTASIKEHGIIQPLVLRKVGDKFEIIAGERRYKAACMAGLTEVPAVITDIDDNESAEIALIENVQRKNLNSMEEAKSYKKILDKGYLNQETLAQKMGISQSTLANKLRLLNLAPEVQDALLHNKISERHARSLLLVNDNNRQIALLNKVMAERLTVRQLDAIIKENTGTNIVQKTNTKTEGLETMDTEEKLDTQEVVESLDEGAKETEVLETLDDEDLKDETPLDKIFAKITAESYPSLEDEVTNMDLDSDEYFNPFNNLDEAEALPVKEEVLFEPEEQTETKKDEPVNPIEPNNFDSIKTAYKNLAKEIEKAGFKISSEDFDFEDIYQVIIKVDKNEQ